MKPIDFHGRFVIRQSVHLPVGNQPSLDVRREKARYSKEMRHRPDGE